MNKFSLDLATRQSPKRAVSPLPWCGLCNKITFTSGVTCQDLENPALQLPKDLETEIPLMVFTFLKRDSHVQTPQVMVCIFRLLLLSASAVQMPFMEFLLHSAESVCVQEWDPLAAEIKPLLLAGEAEHSFHSKIELADLLIIHVSTAKRNSSVSSRSAPSLSQNNY